MGPPLAVALWRQAVRVCAANLEACFLLWQAGIGE